MDLSITPASVVKNSGTINSSYLAEVAMTAGESVYLNASTGKMKKANALTSLATATCKGILLVNCAANQPAPFLETGNIVIGATLTTGAIYILSGANDGGIAPVTDLTAGWFPFIVGIAQSTTVLSLVLATNNPPTAHT